MLKVGLIGCGFMGTMHANCYKNIEGVELVALADLRPEKAQELAQGTNATLYGDGMELIEQADVDVIDICLPTYLHAKYALAAMDKVKYLFVEKPVTLTMEEGDELIAKAEKTGCRVQVGQVIRFWDEYVALRDIIASGKYGKVVNANFRRLSPSPDWGWENWLHNTALSGGAGQDLHIHDIDYVLSVFGEPAKLFSVKNLVGEENSYVNTILQYGDFVVGVEGTWNLPASHPFQATFRVVFEKAVVENDAGKFICYTAEGAEEIKIEKKELALAGGTAGNISDLGGYFNELYYFTSQAKAGAPIEQASLTDAVASLKFLLGKELSFHA
ncbi:MAG: Gfo/Idh/MocA family oxidoreductase [Clostridia bacterium]|nr:Gfo/Idh/MocA family oxidoreductase [Clostridia bacterium]